MSRTQRPLCERYSAVHLLIQLRSDLVHLFSDGLHDWGKSSPILTFLFTCWTTWPMTWLNWDKNIAQLRLGYLLTVTRSYIFQEFLQCSNGESWIFLFFSVKAVVDGLTASQEITPATLSLIFSLILLTKCEQMLKRRRKVLWKQFSLHLS